MLWRGGQEDEEFEASLSYIRASLSEKKKKKKKKKKKRKKKKKKNMKKKKKPN